MRIISILLLGALLCAGCGPQLPAPEVGSVYLDLDRALPVWVDGVFMGEGSMSLYWVINYPNYIRVGDWRFISCTVAGLDTLSLKGRPEIVDYAGGGVDFDDDQ